MRPVYLFLFLTFLVHGGAALSGPIRDECVVLLHGIGRSSRSMGKLEKYFDKAGYFVLNVDYPSTKMPIKELAKHVHGTLVTSKCQLKGRLHFVTHSMGGLVVRQLIAKHRPSRLGRVVMLGPPNQGSQVADFWRHFFLYRKLFGPAGQELTTGHAQSSGKVDFELGIIAGDRSIAPLSSMMIPGPDDGRVGVANTTLAGMKERVIVHATHTFMMRNQDVMNLAANFVSTGTFEKTTCPGGGCSKEE